MTENINYDCRDENEKAKCLATREHHGVKHTCERETEHTGTCRCSCKAEWMRGHWE